jgi:hypothetical protein
MAKKQITISVEGEMLNLIRQDAEKSSRTLPGQIRHALAIYYKTIPIGDMRLTREGRSDRAVNVTEVTRQSSCRPPNNPNKKKRRQMPTKKPSTPKPSTHLPAGDTTLATKEAGKPKSNDRSKVPGRNEIKQARAKADAGKYRW